MMGVVLMVVLTGDLFFLGPDDPYMLRQLLAVR